MASESSSLLDLLNPIYSLPGDNNTDHLSSRHRKERPGFSAASSSSSSTSIKLSAVTREENFLLEDLKTPIQLQSPRSSTFKSPTKTKLPKVENSGGGSGVDNRMKYNPGGGGSNLRKTGAGRTSSNSPTKKRLPLIRTSKASSLEESEHPLR